MVVHLNVLSLGIKDRVLCYLDVVEVVTVDRCWIGHLLLQILNRPVSTFPDE